MRRETTPDAHGVRGRVITFPRGCGIGDYVTVTGPRGGALAAGGC
jgi:hypothetical protein